MDPQVGEFWYVNYAHLQYLVDGTPVTTPKVGKGEILALVPGGLNCIVKLVDTKEQDVLNMPKANMIVKC